MTAMSDNQIEYILRIDVFKPESAPMQKLAEYLLQLAKLLGETEHVHFSQISEGSLQLHALADFVAEPRIQDRLAAIQEKGTDSYAVNETINKMLAKDNAVGGLYRKPARDSEATKILTLSGRDKPKPREFKLKQQGSIEGILVRLGGKDASIHAELDAGEGRYQKCTMDRALAIELAPHMFRTPLRLQGNGSWRRDEDGKWTIEEFKAQSFEELRDEDLPEALKLLREVPLMWDGDMAQELRRLREED
jgi:hypothetical protein